MHFSIIIPLFNKEDYIERTINSILNQSYKNYEIIVIDDGSTDSSRKIVNKFSNEIIKYYYQSNSGVSSARNTGAKNAKYEYIVFLDSDDTWSENFLEELAFLIFQHPHAKLFGINQYFKYKNGETFYIDYKNILSGTQAGIIDDYFKVFSDFGKSPFSNSSCCFHLSTFLKEGGYKVGVSLTEDSDIWCRFALKYQIAFCNKPLATYYIETPNNTRMQFDWDGYQVIKTLQIALVSGNVPEKYKNSVNNLIGYFELSYVKRAILLGYKSAAFKSMFKINLFKYYFLQNIFLMFLLIFPNSVLNFVRIKYFHRSTK